MNPSRRFTLASGIAAAVLAVAVATATAHGQVAVRNQGYIPFSDEPIRYRDPVDDPIARLQQKLDAGETALEWEAGHGYLRSVLEKLAIPSSSQTLVFSKTSFQYKQINPQAPRALYFNDDVYVGQVREGKVLEFVSFDAKQGAIFYILDEQKAERPVFQRAELDCSQCHIAAATRGVPGVLVRSIFANPTGTQATQAATFVTGHQSPLKDRFGGWYVTGTHGTQTHMGNVVIRDKANPEDIDRAAGANVTDLSSLIDTAAFLTPHSDIVAQMVQAHQTQMHNLITLTNYQTRIALHAETLRTGRDVVDFATLSVSARAQYEKPAEELVRYLLFADEARLDSPVRGTSGFTEQFAARGPFAPDGRSLRQFDLATRLFTYPCSYLIYSDAFDAIPEPAKSYVYRRLFEVLSSRDQSPEFASLSAADRQAIFEILLATKPQLPAEWRTQSTAETHTTNQKRSHS